jgi:hypothetical protein
MDQTGNYMRAFEVEVVVWSIDICRNNRGKVAPVLIMIYLLPLIQLVLIPDSEHQSFAWREHIQDYSSEAGHYGSWSR